MSNIDRPALDFMGRAFLCFDLVQHKPFVFH